MHWKEFAKEYLNFSRKDRIGLLSVTVLIVLVFISPYFFNNNNAQLTQTADTSWIAALKRITVQDEEDKPGYKKYNGDEAGNYQFDITENTLSYKNKGALFYFDPNTITGAEWERLGLRTKTIATIKNYLSKGGRFKKPEDLEKIYGLFPNEFERIAPYIKIEPTASVTKYNDTGNNTVKEMQTTKDYRARYSAVDINTADTTALIALPGIGSKLAARIINFRDKLGGFYKTEQVAETFGLPDSSYQKLKQYLKLENVAVRKININKASVDELKNHPYIRYTLANPIVAYRNEHGSYTKLEDLKKIMAVTYEVYNKIAPYLSVQ